MARVLTRLSQLAIRRPVLIAAIWWSAVGVFAVIGLGVGDRLHRTGLGIPGTPADNAGKLEEKHFGPRWPVAVVLDGPPGAVEAQGPVVTRALDRVRGVTVFGPWSGAGGRSTAALRPKPGRALVIATVHRRFEQASKETDPALRKALDAAAHAPVEARLAGVIDAADAINDETVSAIERAEIVAGPILLIVLLLVLGTPVAALIPLALGGSVVAFSTGVLDIINRFTPLDAIALNLASMMGLALGVDYALLTVARFRREKADGAGVEEAATVALATAGRTVRFAGLVLAVAMTTALVLAPGGILTSGSVGTLTAVGISLLSSYTVLPAALVFWDKHLERWRIVPGAANSERWGQRAFALIRRPGLAAAVVALGLLALAAPALGIVSGPPDTDVLPPGTPAREDFRVIRKEFGRGWGAPFQVTVVVPKGTVTEGLRLRALSDFERRLNREPLVETAFGPGAIEPRTVALRAVPARLARASGQLRSGLGGLKRLDAGLTQA
ncbi:MAG TPA: MMPL family transporter, partial [Thermoleophilaceae bacterium]